MNRLRYQLIQRRRDLRWVVTEADIIHDPDPRVVAECPIPHAQYAPAPLHWAMDVTGQPRDVWHLPAGRTRGWVTQLVPERRIAAILHTDVTHIGVAMIAGLHWCECRGQDDADRWLRNHRRSQLGRHDEGRIMTLDDALGLTLHGRALLLLPAASVG